MRATLVRLHRLLGIMSSLLLAVAAMTALLMNHRDQVRSLLDPPATSSRRSGSPYSQYLLSMARDPRDGRHLLLGTADGLYQSHDSGVHWAAVALPLPARQVVALAFSPALPARLLVGLRNGQVFESTDGGEHFGALPPPWPASDPPELVAISLTPRGTWCLATTRGIYTQQGEEAEVSATTGWDLVEAPRDAATPLPSRRLLRLVYDLHDGRLWGAWGVLVTDVTSLAILGLLASGLLTLVPARRRERTHPPTDPA